MGTNESSEILKSGHSELIPISTYLVYNYLISLREESIMREYTAKEMKQLKANPYTFKVTKQIDTI